MLQYRPSQSSACIFVNRTIAVLGISVLANAVSFSRPHWPEFEAREYWIS